MRGKLVALVVGLLLALGAGFGVGYLVLQPRISSLQGTRDEQAKELAATRTQASERGALAQTRLQELGDVKAVRTGLEAELQATTTALAQARTRLAEAQATLDSTQANLATRSQTLEKAQRQVRELESLVASLNVAQRDLGAAVKLQAEVVTLITEKVSPALGDADLVARQGLRAADNANYNNAVLFFEDAVVAYNKAQDEVKKAVAKRKELVGLVPLDLRDSFARAQKQEEGRLRAVNSRVFEYRAAAKLNLVVAEWFKKEQKGTAEDVKKWRVLADEAETQINEAMTLLDQADEWAPELWREFEVQRIGVQRWRGLTDGIRFFILEQR